LLSLVRLPTVDCDFETFSGNRIKKIEDLVAAFLASRPEAVPKPVKDVPPEFVLLPSRLNDSTLESQDFAPGDRVLFALDFGTLPFGLKGVVVGVTKKYPRVEVLFDEPTFSGTDLDGRCSKQRGAIVHTSSLLNLTNRQLPLKKVAAAGDLVRPASLAALLTSSAAFPSSMLPLQSLLISGHSSSPGPGGRHSSGARSSPSKNTPVKPVPSRAPSAARQTAVTKEASYSNMQGKAAPPPSPGQARVPTFPAPPQAHHLPTPAMADPNLQASKHLLFMLNPAAVSTPSPPPGAYSQPPPHVAPSSSNGSAESSRQASIALLSMLGVNPATSSAAPPAAAPALAAPAPVAAASTSSDPMTNLKVRNDLLQMLGQPVPQAAPPAPSTPSKPKEPAPKAQPQSPSPSPSKSQPPAQEAKPTAQPGEPRLLLPNMKWKVDEGQKKK